VPDNHNPQPAPNSIDVDAVIRRARRRRTPKTAGLISLGALATAAILGGLSVPHFFAEGSSASTSASQGFAADSAPKPRAADLPELCGRPAPALTPGTGLFATATSTQIELKNTGPVRIVGMVGSETVLVASKGTVVGYWRNTAVPHRVNLASGDSDVVKSAGSPLSCGSGAPLDAGKYSLYAQVPLAIGNLDEIVTGPGTPVILH
jgi:hypothetical protein